MTTAIRSVTSNTNNGSSPTVAVTTSESPSATQVGDLVVVIHCNDFYALSNMPTPTATGSPTLTAITNGAADGGTDLAHVKSYTYVANTAGAQTISVTETGSANEEKAIIAYVLAGADTSTPIDVAGNDTSAVEQSNWVLSAVSPTSSDAFLIGHCNSGGPGATANGHGSPGSMTERYDSGDTRPNIVGATEQLSASGSTGTRTFTAGTADRPWGGVLIAIRTASGEAPIGDIPQDQRWPLYAGRLRGRWPQPQAEIVESSVAVTQFDGAGDLPVTDSITAAGQTEGSSSLAVTASITASGEVRGSATLTVTDSITSAERAEGTASLAVTATITAAGDFDDGSYDGTSTLTITDSITASGEARGSTSLTVTDSITSSGRAEGSASVAATGSISGGGQGQGTSSTTVTAGITPADRTQGTAALAVTATITASGALGAFTGQSATTVTATITASGEVRGTASLGVTATSSPQGETRGTSSLSVTAGRSSSGNPTGSAVITSTCTLTAAGRAQGIAALAITCTIVIPGTSQPPIRVTVGHQLLRVTGGNQQLRVELGHQQLRIERGLG